jgi:putative hydrolase of the HAD superfamily
MSLKLITIDFWNTLFDSENGFARNQFRLNSLKSEIEALGYTITEKEFNPAIEASWGYFHNIWRNEHRTPSTASTVEFLFDYLNLPKKPEIIENVAEAFGDCIIYHPPNLLPGAKQALEELKKSGYELGIVSDTGFSPGKTLRKVLYDAGIYNYFSEFSFSDETGYSKPSKESFLAILNKYQIEPHVSLHIGDIEETDIVGAKKLGMKAIKFIGDKTSTFVSKNNHSIADAICKDWSEVVSTVNELNSSII